MLCFSLLLGYMGKNIVKILSQTPAPCVYWYATSIYMYMSKYMNIRDEVRMKHFPLGGY